MAHDLSLPDSAAAGPLPAFAPAEPHLHDPRFFLMRGRVVAHEDRPERATRLSEGLARLGITAKAPPPATAAALETVHTARYVAFVLGAWEAWQALPNAGPEVVANVQPRDPVASYPDALVGRAGWHLGDLAAPIGEGSAMAAAASAGCALAAAEAVGKGAPAAYAQCRPPGHHASAEVAGGHCLFNNAALAADQLARAGRRVAVLDIDVHHGNGTQAIFYGRGDILTVSIHADPHAFYPFYLGHAHEEGEGEGAGANLNIPLPLGSDDEAWLAALDRALSAIARFGAETLVVSAGFDVHVSDPLAGMRVSTQAIGEAGARIAATGLPAAIVQEGGYVSDALADNVAAFLRPFAQGMR